MPRKRLIAGTECLLCFLKQVDAASKLVNAGPVKRKRLFRDVSRILSELPLKFSPPEIGRISYRYVKKALRCMDPYKKIKTDSNRKALGVYRRLKRIVSASRDRLLTAVSLAIAGNILDFGVNQALDVRRELKKILISKNLFSEKRKYFDYTEFKKMVDESQTILYLADNAGETVFDRILIEEIRLRNPDAKLFYAVKAEPAINDALMNDALVCGIDQYAEIICSGSDASGTILRLCTDQFKKIFSGTDMIISKGQGNFETLTGEKKEIFFLFMVKCVMVADHTGCNLGDAVLLRHSEKRWSL